jgi:hypothetical protein
MAACSTWNYTNVTPTVFQNLQALGKQYSFSITGAPSGKFVIKVAGMEVGFQYTWDRRSGHLLLTCVTKPMMLGCATIKSFADKIITQSGGKVS